MDKTDETKTKHHSNSMSSSNELSKSEVKSIYELIKLHKKYEEDAVRHYRKGYSSPRGVDVETDNPSNGLRKVESKLFLQELLKTQRRQEKKIADLGEKLTLRLPKFEGIATVNKAIFHTALPVIPSLKKTEPRKHFVPKRQKRKKLDDVKNTFFQVRPLLSDEAILSDMHVISQVRESNCTMGHDVLPNIDITQLPSKLNSIMQLKEGDVSYRSSPGTNICQATSNTMSTYKQLNKGVTQAKVTLSNSVVTQRHKDPSNKNRSMNFGKTPQNSPRNSLVKESLSTRKVHGYGCHEDEDAIDLSKGERKVHFNKNLTKVHRYTVKNL